MKSSIKYFLVAIAVLVLFLGCESQQVVEKSSPDKHVCSACDMGQSGGTVWCDSCNAGFVKGKKVKCKHCFEGMSGEKSGWCESCNAGYLKGEKVDCKKCCTTGAICETCQVSKISSDKHVCSACEKSKSGETAWCDSCGAGYVKGEKVKCKHCFEGMSGEKSGWCESCNAGYLEGEKVDCKKCCTTGVVCETCQSKP
ncbi:MAG: hypothetical protein HOI47_23380 [Candidatus Scalindua sp.]|nr:hypothetical protein [Candidatus Scalindua sp.]